MSRQLLKITTKFNTPCDEPYTVVEDDETFHIGQIYEKQAATTIECTKCKSRVFNVGFGSYFTAIRCVNCEWEVCVHDG